MSLLMPGLSDCSEAEFDVMRGFIKSRNTAAAVQFFKTRPPGTLWGSLTNSLTPEDREWFMNLPMEESQEYDINNDIDILD